MSDVNIYKLAAQIRPALRFASCVGELTVEQLFQLPLKSERVNVADLHGVGQKVLEGLKTMGEESLVETKSTDPLKQRLELSLEILKDVIATKKLENQAKEEKSAREAEKFKIKELLDAKKDEALSKASEEDLRKRLAELNAAG